MPETFDTQLTKLIAAELFFLLAMHAARDLFEKSYFALGIAEKAAVDQTVQLHVWANYTGLTPDILKAPRAPQPAGFQTHPAGPPSPGPIPLSADDPKS